jgi:enamine deaminase RidA (YjgF/YER057c/UK114 family)
MLRKNISSNSKFESEIGYSRAVVHGSWVFVSGTTGYSPFPLPSPFLSLNKARYDYATGIISPSIIDQAEQTLKNIDVVLKKAGVSMRDVVRVRYILPNGKEFPKVWPILRKWFGEGRPAATSE